MTQGGPTKVARFGDCGYVRDAQNALGSERYEHMMSATDPAFLGVLENWLHSRPEVLVLIRYSLAAGGKEFELFSSYKPLITRLSGLPPGTSIIVFREPQLPLRGVVDRDFISDCLNALPDGLEFLLLESPRRDSAEVVGLDWTAGETHAELREALDNAVGSRVAVGPYPPWLGETNEVIAAVVPDRDGIVRPGTY